MMATGIAHRKIGAIQLRKESPLAYQTTISESRNVRVIVVNTAINNEADKITGKAVIVENNAMPKTTSAPMLPLAASPTKRTSNTLNHTISSVDKTTPAWLRISDTALRLNKDMRQ